jgi:hypothetical protein
MPLSVLFWQELRSNSKKEWPEIVRKHKLTCDEIEKVAKRLREENDGMAAFGAWRK